MTRIRNLSRSFSGSFSRRKAPNNVSFTTSQRESAVFTGAPDKFTPLRRISGVVAGESTEDCGESWTACERARTEEAIARNKQPMITI